MSSPVADLESEAASQPLLFRQHRGSLRPLTRSSNLSSVATIAATFTFASRKRQQRQQSPPMPTSTGSVPETLQFKQLSLLLQLQLFSSAAHFFPFLILIMSSRFRAKKKKIGSENTQMQIHPDRIEFFPPAFGSLKLDYLS